jgi:hypothetical protein
MLDVGPLLGLRRGSEVGGKAAGSAAAFGIGFVPPPFRGAGKYSGALIESLSASADPDACLLLPQMLYEHSGRVGFDNAKANLSVPTPPKEQVCAMLGRETQLRNAPATQRLLDRLGDDGDEEVCDPGHVCLAVRPYASRCTW